MRRGRQASGGAVVSSARVGATARACVGGGGPGVRLGRSSQAQRPADVRRGRATELLAGVGDGVGAGGAGPIWVLLGSIWVLLGPIWVPGAGCLARPLARSGLTECGMAWSVQLVVWRLRSVGDGGGR